MIDIVERKANASSSGGTMVLKCKNFRTLTFEILGFTEFTNIATSIEWLSNLNDARLLYPHFYNPEFKIVEDGWNSFCIETEFANLTNFSDEWRISNVNKNFEVSAQSLISLIMPYVIFLQICPSYPELVIVPKSMSDECLISISQFRCLGRFPVLSYYHKSKKVFVNLFYEKCNFTIFEMLNFLDSFAPQWSANGWHKFETVQRR